MKQYIWKGTVIIVLLILAIILIIFAYFLLADIQSTEPESLLGDFQLMTKKYKGRKVFVVKFRKEEAEKKSKEQNENKKQENYILYFHGGAYVGEMTEQHWKFIQRLAKDTSSTIIIPDYPLTPKYTYEDVFSMIVPLYEEMIQDINPEQLIMMGDSAGGGIALALEEKLTEEKISLPKQLILLSPWLDVRMTNPKIEEVVPFDQELNKDVLKMAGISYAGKDGLESYLVNPILGPVNQLKNVNIFTGTYDILNPDVSLLKEKAEKEGVLIDVKEYEGKSHIWMVNEENPEGYSDLIACIQHKE